jgi:hypothetical protein
MKKPWIITQPPEVTKNYKLGTGSVWIQAKLPNNTAPADRYCSIRVKGGSITLDAVPQLINNKLVVPRPTTCIASLKWNSQHNLLLPHRHCMELMRELLLLLACQLGIYL